MVYWIALPVAHAMYGVLDGPSSNSDYVWFWKAFSVAKAVSRQYLNLEARFRSQGESVWDVCWTKRKGGNICAITSVFPCWCHSDNAPHLVLFCHRRCVILAIDSVFEYDTSLLMTQTQTCLYSLRQAYLCLRMCKRSFYWTVKMLLVWDRIFCGSISKEQ